MTLKQRWKITSLSNKLIVIIGSAQTFILALSLLATNYALQVSVETSQSDQRAWIAIESMSLTQLESGKTLKSEVKILNTGKSAALTVSYPGGIQTSMTTLDIDNFVKSSDMPKSQNPHKIGALFPNIDVTMPAETSTPLNAEQVGQINNRQLLVYVFGEINYKDAFKHPHITQFCGLYVPATTKFEACGQYDKVD